MPPPGYEPFLRAICANPEDDVARLVYADWLDENGDPARAEFIRLGVDCHRAPRTDHKPDPRLLRINQLLKAHREEWTAELPGPAILWEEMFGWWRGFPECVAVVGREVLFLRHAAEIIERTPARSLVLAVLSDPPATLAALGACPHVRHFHSLYTARTRVRDAGAEAIADSPHFAGMEWLHLAENGITDTGGLALAHSPHLTRVRGLDLNRNEFGPAAREALTARYGTSLRLSPPTG